MAAAVAASAAFTDYATLPRQIQEPVFAHAVAQYQVEHSSAAARRVVSPPNTSVRLAAHCWRTPHADYVDYRLRTLDHNAVLITRKFWWRTANELERALDERDVDVRRPFWTQGVEPALKDAGYLGGDNADGDRVREIVKQYRGYMDMFDAILDAWAKLEDYLNESEAARGDLSAPAVVALEARFLASLDDTYAACQGMPCYPEGGPRDCSRPWASDAECVARDDTEARARGGRREGAAWIPCA